jgi:hypothetical protein
VLFSLSTSEVVRPVLVELSAGYGKKYDCGRVVSEARAWVMSNDQSWPFSFINVCDALELDMACVRRAVGV